MGLRLSVERGALRVVDGFTHYPQERRDLLFFPADRKLPSRIVIVDGKGSISIDALAWLAEQRVPLVRVNWRGEATFAIGGAAAQLDPERIAWQVETRRDEARRAAFVRELLRDKIAACLRTLETTAPPSKAKDGALGLHQVTLQRFAESSFNGLSIDALRTLEARCAAAYFAAFTGLPLQWLKRSRHPIPEHWLVTPKRASEARSRPKNRHADHPVNAMLNYGYAVLASKVQIDIAAQGFDPRLGVYHHERSDAQAFVYDLMEPARPLVDAAVYKLALGQKLTGADFILLSDGVCRLSPQLARLVCAEVEKALYSNAKLIPAWRTLMRLHAAGKARKNLGL